MIYIKIEENNSVTLGGQVVDSYMEQMGYVSYDGEIPIIPDLEYSYLAFVNGTLTICFYEDKIDKLQNHLIESIKNIHEEKLTTSLSDITNAEMHSWNIQSAEAQSVMNGVDVETPLIDALIVSRKMNETREEFAQKVLNAKQQYEIQYAAILGDYQYNLKRIKNSETVEKLLKLKMEILNESN